MDPSVYVPTLSLSLYNVEKLEPFHTQPRYPTNIRGLRTKISTEIISMNFLATDLKIVFVFIFYIRKKGTNSLVLY